MFTPNKGLTLTARYPKATFLIEYWPHDFTMIKVICVGLQGNTPPIF